MDLDLDTLKREILDYLNSAGFAVFRSTPGGLEGMPLVLWDSESYPDYQMFLEAARKAGANLILFASAEFTAEEIEDSLEQLEQADLERAESRDLEKRLRDLRGYEGQTCTLEMAFDHNGHMYVYEIRPDWYDEFLSLGEEISEHLPDSGDGDDSLGGYFSKN